MELEGVNMRVTKALRGVNWQRCILSSLSSDTRHAAISLHHYLISLEAVCASGMDRFWNALTYRIESHLQYPSATYLELNLKGQGDTELCVVTFAVIVQWASNHSVSSSVPSPYCCHITQHCIIMTNLIPKYLFSLRAIHFKLRESSRLNVCTASPVGLKLLIICCCVTVKSVGKTSQTMAGEKGTEEGGH